MSSVKPRQLLSALFRRSRKNAPARWGGYSGSWSGPWGSTTVNVQPGPGGSTQTTVNGPYYSGSWGSSWGNGGNGAAYPHNQQTTTTTTTTTTGPGGATTSSSTYEGGPNGRGRYTYNGYGTSVNVDNDGSTRVDVKTGRR